MSAEDDMWRDYDHYMHTGELSEYFEEEYFEEYGEEEYESVHGQNNTTNSYSDDLDDVIRYLKQLKKENERILKEEKKKEKAQKKLVAQKKSAAQKKSSVKKESVKEPLIQEKEPDKTGVKSVAQENAKSKNKGKLVVYILLAFMLLFLIAMFL